MSNQSYLQSSRCRIASFMADSKHIDEGEEESFTMPKMKVVSKPKNLRKRKREEDQAEDDADALKKSKTQDGEEESGLSKMEELRLMQQMRTGRQRGSDMSSEHVQLSKAALGDGTEQSIGSLKQNFTGQRAQVNTLDKRMEEYIEAEMAKRKANRATQGDEIEEAQDEPVNVPVPEEDEDEEEEPSALQEARKKQEEANKPRVPTTVIDLSHASLRATSSTASEATASSSSSGKSFHHRHDSGPPTTGILEVDLPVEEQLRMFEKTREAALKALRDQRKKRPHKQAGADDLDDFGDNQPAPSNLSSDFSRHKQKSYVGGKATDEQVYDKFKKKQASMLR